MKFLFTATAAILLTSFASAHADSKQEINDAYVIKNISPSLYYTAHNISINPAEDLNRATQKEIYDKRRQHTDSSYFFPKDYSPSPKIFSQIKDGKMWKGIFDYHCMYKQNNDDTLGNSFVSRDINNPDILVGLAREASVHITPGSEPLWFCNPPNDLLPQRMYYNEKYNLLTVEYTLDSRITQYKFTSQHSLSDLNARDLGYNYIYILKSQNIKMANPRNITQQPYETKDFIHVGKNCSAQGGCNNVSPSKPETVFEIKDFPAELLIKLWKEKPQNTTIPADIYVRLIIKENK